MCSINLIVVHGIILTTNERFVHVYLLFYYYIWAYGPWLCTDNLDISNIHTNSDGLPTNDADNMIRTIIILGPRGKL